MELQNFQIVFFWFEYNTKHRAGSRVNGCKLHRRDALWDFHVRQNLSAEKLQINALHFGLPQKWDALVRRHRAARASMPSATSV